VVVVVPSTPVIRAESSVFRLGMYNGLTLQGDHLSKSA
jgi:hypothetical protein